MTSEGVRLLVEAVCQGTGMRARLVKFERGEIIEQVG